MPLAFSVPIVRILVHIEGAVGVPVAESVPSLRRSVGVPFRSSGTYIFSRMLRVIGSGEIRVELANVAATVAVGAQYVAYADCVFPQAALGPFGHTVECDSAPFRVHSGQEYPSVGAAERTVAHCAGQDYAFLCEIVEVGSPYRVCLPAGVRGEFRFIPESHSLISELVRENIDDVGMLFLC